MKHEILQWTKAIIITLLYAAFFWFMWNYGFELIGVDILLNITIGLCLLLFTVWVRYHLL